MFASQIHLCGTALGIILLAMVKQKSEFICQNCGHSEARWFGKCPDCGTWNAAVETVVQSTKSKSGKLSIPSGSTPISLPNVSASKSIRTATKITELDRVLSGGIVPGQVILISGEPGIGKSTLLLQVANTLDGALYASGEESAGQLAIRAQRLGIKNKKIEVLEETDIDSILATANSYQTIPILIIDSIQTMQTSDLTGTAGSVGQVRECAFRVTRYAKTTGTPVVIIGHITKSGTMAGPSTLAHIVDTVLTFEGEKNLNLRLLRANKNRFGATDEAGIFEMTDKGLSSLTNTDKIFLSEGTKQIPGACISSILEGSRPILVEVQALVVPNKSGFSKKIAQGISQARLELLVAILIRRCGLPLYEFDIFVNIAGGIKANEPAVDLASCLAIASAYFDKPLPGKSMATGEVGLLGDIREVVAQRKRITEGKRLGFKTVFSNSDTPYLNELIRKIFK